MTTTTQHLERAGTEGPYIDARLYDHVYRARKHDVAFYVDLARRVGGDVLELGVGTGRVAIALARAGVRVVGIDAMDAMLDRARERLEREPSNVRARVTLRRGDFRRFSLRQRFPLVIAPFNAWMHLYAAEDFARASACVAAHLRPNGRFAFDVLVPQPASLARNPAKIFRCGTMKHPATGETFRYGEAFDYDAVRQVQHVSMIFDDPKTGATRFVLPLAHRQFFPAELVALLRANGLEPVDRFGDFERRALTSASESQVLVCRPAKPRRR